MQKTCVLVATILGSALGVWFFMARRNPPARLCWRAGRFTRQMLFTAVLVSGLLSYVSAFAVSLLAGESGGTTNSPSIASGTTTNAFMATKEWQDLKVFWNLITGDPRFFQKDPEDSENGFRHWRSSSGRISEWQAMLLDLALAHRLTQLDALERRGMITSRRNQAIQRLFKEMLAHFSRANSGMTCYISMPGYRSAVDDISALMEQARQLRTQYQKGVLSDRVVLDMMRQIADHLEAMDILSLYPGEVVSEREIVARMNPWRKDHDPRGKQDDLVVRRAIATEIIEKKERNNSGNTSNRYIQSWRQERAEIVSLVVEFSRYRQDAAAEKAVKDELSGPIGRQQLLQRFKEDRTNTQVIGALGELRAVEAISMLKELLTNDEVALMGRSTNVNEDAMNWYIYYPIRQSAALALGQLGVDTKEAKDEGYLVNSAQARDVVRNALLSTNDSVRNSALQVASTAEDPLLADLLRDPSLRKGETNPGPEPSAAQIIQRADRGEIDLVTAQYELGRIGNNEAIAFLGKNMRTSPDSYVRYGAIHVLSGINSPKTVPHLEAALKDPVSMVRFGAACSLGRLGNRKGIKALQEYVKHGDTWEKDAAVSIIEESKGAKAKGSREDLAPEED